MDLGGMTIAEMMSRMSAKEYIAWRYYYQFQAEKKQPVKSVR